MDALCLEFVNSEFRDFRGRWVEDRLQKPEWREQFLMRWGLRMDTSPDMATLAALVALRMTLRQMIEAIMKGTLADSDIVALNRLLLANPVSQQLTRDERGYHLELVPLQKDWDWVQAEIIASFASVLEDYEPQRLKICENAHCRWIFYDESKSRTRRYCTNNICGNLMKSRRFHARHKSGLG